MGNKLSKRQAMFLWGNDIQDKLQQKLYIFFVAKRLIE